MSLIINEYTYTSFKATLYFLILPQCLDNSITNPCEIYLHGILHSESVRRRTLNLYFNLLI